MSKRDSKLLVGDILESAGKILEYTQGLSFEEFVNDSKTSMACEGGVSISDDNPTPAAF